MDGDISLMDKTQMSFEASSMFPGFRFSPTDEELISYYLKNKVNGAEKCVEIITEVELWKYEPWDLPGQSVIRSDSEWFFFSPRGKKYPNGSQSKRATEMGYWKATGKERNVKSDNVVIGTKRTLVFHIGRAPKGERTEWIMHEYCPSEKSQDSMVVCRLRKNSDFCLNENRDSLSQRQLSTVHNSSCGASEVGNDQGGKTDEYYQKKYSSSNDSSSIEQIVSASESNIKFPTDVTQTGSSCHHKDFDEDDYFADILKDDIIQLDESSLSTTPEFLPMDGNMLEAEHKSQQPVFCNTLQDHPAQGTANRRIRLRKHKSQVDSSETIHIGNLVHKTKCAGSKQSPKCLTSTMSVAKEITRYRILFLLLVIVVVLSLSWRDFLYAKGLYLSSS